MSWLGRPEWPRERLWLWRVGFPPVRAIVNAVVPVHVDGRENLPAAGGYLLVSNHISWLDPPMLEFALEEPIRFMAKEEVFAVPVIGFVLRAIGNFPVRRGESDRRALETALRALAAGQPVGFFPEGTRSKDGCLRRAKPGIAFLARRSGVPVVPVAVMGTRRARISVGRRSRVLVRVGRPIAPPEVAAMGTDDQALADAIMRRVASLLPEPMRGAYADTA
ncbi:MAG: 1-acyl-sn-glycerol-3-phosphate acyltransferase [Chloroflexota bacterium]|nr:1-acyl-sn-glycerol-3-phosphate acyltransferase [Chloroflexota bacterium]